MRPILYLAGPYTRIEERTVADNIATAREFAIAAVKAGWFPFTPHLNTAGFEEECPDVPHRDWVEGDLSILDSLDPETSAVLMLPGWKESPGAWVEYVHAKARGMIIFVDATEPAHIPSAWHLNAYREFQRELESQKDKGHHSVEWHAKYTTNPLGWLHMIHLQLVLPNPDTDLCAKEIHDYLEKYCNESRWLMEKDRVWAKVVFARSSTEVKDMALVVKHDVLEYMRKVYAVDVEGITYTPIETYERFACIRPVEKTV